MTNQHETYDDLLADGWVPDTAKGVTTRTHPSLSLCLVHDGRRIGCVQGYGRTLAAARVGVVAEATKWLRRHEREEGTDVLSHRHRDQSTTLRSGEPHTTRRLGHRHPNPPDTEVCNGPHMMHEPCPLDSFVRGDRGASHLS